MCLCTKNIVVMKLFAIGNYDKYAVYALVIAETEEQALEKIKKLKEGDCVGGFGDADYPLDEFDLEEGASISDLKETKRVTEITSGIYFMEN